MPMTYEVFLKLREKVPEAQIYSVVLKIAPYEEETADLLIEEVHFIQSLPKYVKLAQIQHLKYPILAATLAFCGVVDTRHVAEYYDIRAEVVRRANIPCMWGSRKLHGAHKLYLWGDVLEWVTKWKAKNRPTFPDNTGTGW